MLALLATVALIGAGCGGIRASQSVSPASFFVPGLLLNTPECGTNCPVVMLPSDQFNQLASVR